VARDRAAGTRWKEALRRPNERCEAVICLLSRPWDNSYEWRTEYRSAEDRGKPIFPVRLEPASGRDITGSPPWGLYSLAGHHQPGQRPADATGRRWLDLPADSHPLIDALVARRLLVKDERDGEVIVEVALESLLGKWDELPTLDAWS
jgi:hypothetical protein